MLLTNVTKQLKALLPYNTDLFSDKNKIIEYSYFNNILQIKTANIHDLEESDFIILKGLKSKYKLFDLTYEAATGVITARLPINHEVFITDKTITLQGFTDNSFNGEFPIIKLDDLTCCLQLPPNLPEPILNNNETVCKELAFDANNMFKVNRVIDSYTFTVNTYLFNSNYEVNNAYIVTSRVAATAEDPGAFLAKESQNRSYMYVTLSQVQINKKSTLDFSKSEDRFMIGDEISIYAILPCLTDSTGYFSTDLMRSEVFNAINKSILYGVFDKQQPNRKLSVSAVEKVKYTKAQLIYVFKYVLPREITGEDGFDRVLERRFRELYFEVKTENHNIQAIIDMFNK